jgi:hypothetical protein
VIQHLREKFSCRTYEGITQPPVSDKKTRWKSFVEAGACASPKSSVVSAAMSDARSAATTRRTRVCHQHHMRTAGADDDFPRYQRQRRW